MKNSRLPVVLLALGLAACSRSFEPPPPVPVISSIDPPQGYKGTSVVVQGENFSTEIGGNLVFFGSLSAKILKVDSGSLEVEVPQLQAGERVFLTVSTSQGQAVSPQPFAYLGPGHPIQEDLHHVIGVPSGPLAVTPGRYLAGRAPPLFVVNTWSRTVGLVGLEDRAHYGVGVTDSPFSLARAVDASGHSVAYVSTLRSGSGPTLPTRLQRFAIDTQIGIRFIDPVDVDLPDLAGAPFLPAQVWSYCADADCSAMGVAVFDLYRPALVLFDPARPDAMAVKYVGDPDSLCPKPGQARPFADLVRHARDGGPVEDARLIAALAGHPEIWSIVETGLG